MKIISPMLFVILFCMTISLSGQISSTRPIKSFDNQVGDFTSFQELSMPNVEKLSAEDKIEDAFKDIPFRFGFPVEVDWIINELGEIRNFPDGSMIIRFGIHARDAKSINLIFSHFDLPEDGWMHIYNTDRSQLLGAFTEANERSDRQFATSLIFSEKIILEVFYPNARSQSQIKLSHVVYGYRMIDKKAAGLNESGSCNINVICPEAAPWHKQKRSVVMILTSFNSRICTGALINNVKEDGKPFILSANHCTVSTNNIFAFNYDSPTCSPSLDSNLAHTINGINVLARDSKSDFFLGELNTTPPPSFNVYYSGWNNSGEIPGSGTGIHHPRGDVKKIAFSEKSNVSSSYYAKGDDHWKIEYWDSGTTEDASSGSPLFDQYGRIVGQLHGGEASCTTIEEDYYGKFSYSWDYKSDSIRQLKYWLDPGQTGAVLIDGMDPSIAISDYDASLLGIENYEINICGASSFAPKVLVKNRGNLTFDSVQIDFYINNVFDHKVKSLIQLNPGSVISVTGQQINLTSGHYALKAEVKILGHQDQELSNNIVTMEFNMINNPNPLEFVFKGDDYGDEFSWDITSSTGRTLISRGDYPAVSGGGLYRDTVCLSDGCFSLSVFDSFGDGICCAFGNGWYVLRNYITGDTLIKDYAFSSADSTHYFCLGDSCSISARAFVKEPTSGISEDGEIRLDMLLGIPPFNVMWSNGDTGLHITNLDTGLYSAQISDQLNCMDTLHYNLGIGTGVRNLSQNEFEFMVYPNPSRGLFFIRGLETIKEFNITLYDLTGKLLYEEHQIKNETKYQVDAQNLQNGIYILIISGNHFSSASKVLIHK